MVEIETTSGQQAIRTSRSRVLFAEMRIARGFIVVGTALALCLPEAAVAATTEVGVKDFQFDPSTTAVAVGDSVHWSREAGSVAMHSVTANNGFFASGAPTGGAIDVTATFSAGTFRYYCQVHGSPSGGTSSGMNGFVKVPASVNAAPTGSRFTVIWASSASTTGSKYDVQYRVGSGPWKFWLQKTTDLKAVFGKNGDPVTPKAGTAYSFRVASRTNKGASHWSPKVAFTP
jgi:plastocyanin